MTARARQLLVMGIYIFQKNKIWFKLIIVILLCFFAVSCTSFSVKEINQAIQLQKVAVESGENISHIPVFLIEKPEFTYNRIGTPYVVRDEYGKELVSVDSNRATIFKDQKKFSTEIGNYKNLIYRIHFEKVPFSLNDIHLTAGNNVGLLVIFTFNSKDEMVLLTTVHTCGCFLAFIPTDQLQVEALPENWPQRYQKVYQQVLPTIIKAPRLNMTERVLIRLESDTHRVSWIEVLGDDDLERYASAPMKLEQMDYLWELPFEGRRISFFELDGLRKGYVKNNSKPLERIFLSWLALDWFVGEDKAYGYKEKSDTIFYTSLKFWSRAASDMENFPRFLRYWGWTL